MARIVLGVGTSHGPSIQTQPEEWARLAERDTRDPRFDYQDLLRTAKPGLDREVTLSAQRARHSAARRALNGLAEVISHAKLDVALVISNPHSVRRTDQHAVFGVFRSAQFPIMQSGLLFDPDSVFRSQDEKRTSDELIRSVPGNAELANHLIGSLIDQGFDVACIDALPEGHTLDDAFTFPTNWLLGGTSLPIVPFLLSRDLPNQATPQRCYDLGKAIRSAMDAWPTDARVGVIASGGLSHQVVDEELDQMVIRALADENIGALSKLARDRLNRAPGTPEILNWITVAGVMAPARLTLVDYLPCYRSHAGTGHGVAFGYWK